MNIGVMALEAIFVVEKTSVHAKHRGFGKDFTQNQNGFSGFAGHCLGERQKFTQENRCKIPLNPPFSKGDFTIGIQC